MNKDTLHALSACVKYAFNHEEISRAQANFLLAQIDATLSAPPERPQAIQETEMTAALDTFIANKRCPVCNLAWWLFPPVKIHGSDAKRCIECKTVFEEPTPMTTEALRAAREALEPFATFGLTDTDGDIRDGLMRDRVCDWFGPSQFNAARAALTQIDAALSASPERPQPVAPDQHAGANAAGQGGDAPCPTQFLAFGHWTMAQLEEARKIAVEVMKDYGDLVGDEYERFLANPWNDHCSVQAALRAMPKAVGSQGGELEAAKPVPLPPQPDPLLHLEAWQVTRVPGGLHISCSGTTQMDAIERLLRGGGTAAAPLMVGWRPIAELPPREKAILGRWNGHAAGRHWFQSTGMWFDWTSRDGETNKEWLLDGAKDNPFYDENGNYCEPSHFIPLPPPPAGDAP